MQYEHGKCVGWHMRVDIEGCRQHSRENGISVTTVFRIKEQQR